MMIFFSVKSHLNRLYTILHTVIQGLKDILLKPLLCQDVHVTPVTMSIQGMKTVVLVEQTLHNNFTRYYVLTDMKLDIILTQ